MNMKRKVAVLAAGAAVSLGATLVAVAPARAIDRAPCGPDYLQIFSPNTTCWANGGDVDVTLYDTTGLSSGNNQGYVNGSVYDVGFGKYAITGWPGSQTITHIHIDFL